MHKPNPATIIATVALFFSLGGVGVAASRYLITSTSQIKPSVLSKLHGVRGIQGRQGPKGDQGPTGRAGPGVDYSKEYMVSNTSQITVHTSGDGTQSTTGGSAVAACKPGDALVTGGVTLQNANLVQSIPRVVSNWPVDAWWAIGSQTPSQVNSGSSVTAYAICAPLA